jgi:predicted anti-sigma-YlaC factor YlaD
MSGGCPAPQALWEAVQAQHPPALAHLASCPACAALLEEHRQLEKDLLRLVDPLPPADLVPRVLARIAQAPASRWRELRAGASILLTTLGCCALSLLLSAGSIGRMGAMAASSLARAHRVWHGVSHVAQVLWRASPTPLLVALSLLLVVSLAGLKRLAGGWNDTRVMS